MKNVKRSLILAVLLLSLAIILVPISFASQIYITYNTSSITVTVINQSFPVTNYNLTVIQSNHTVTKTSVSNIYGTAKVPVLWIPNSTLTIIVNSNKVVTNKTFVMPSQVVSLINSIKQIDLPDLYSTLFYAVALLIFDFYILYMLAFKSSNITLIFTFLIVSLILNIAGFYLFGYYTQYTIYNTYLVQSPNNQYTFQNKTYILASNPESYLMYIPLVVMFTDWLFLAYKYLSRTAEVVLEEL